MAADSNWAYVKLLLHCDTLTDEFSGSSVTTAGSAAVSTAQKVFGTGSISIPGSGSYVSRPDSDDWTFGASPFTIEMRVRFAAAPTNALLACQWPGGWALYFEAGSLFFRGYTTGNVDTLLYAWTPTLNQWYAIAFDRDGSGNARLYVDGTMVKKTTSYTHTLANSTNPLVIGSLTPASVSGYDLNGFVDEVRITNGVARYATDTSYTVATSAFLPTTSLFLTSGMGIAQPATSFRLGVTNTDNVQVVNNAPQLAQGATLTSGVGIAQLLRVSLLGVLRERIGVSELTAQTAFYRLSLSDVTRMAGTLLAGRPVNLTTGIGMHDVSRAAIGAYVLDRLGLRDVLAPAAKYGLVTTDRVRISDALRRFLGAVAADTLGMHDAALPGYFINRTLTDGVGIASTVAPKLLVRITLSDRVRVTPATALKMLFKPVLTDAVEISAAHVSPNGTITTWVVNTRTGAVTEYGNYDFNSFAQRGHRYLGAASTGLYELDGDDDEGTDIVARIKSGWAQFAGSRYSMFKAAYLGVHGSGDVFFKLEAGTGETYTYQVKLQDTQTTKVRMGKGLRARYFSFELVTTGQDFDLDNIEFVPIVAQRRV